MTNPENPLAPSQEYIERIRRRAYHLWENDGRPDGKADEYWERARELEAMESYPSGLVDNPQTAHPQRQSDAPVVEEAFIEENLGEFPGLQTDQGDKKQTPSVRKVARKPKSAPK